MRMESWSGRRQRWDWRVLLCGEVLSVVVDVGGVMAFPFASRGFQRLSIRKPGFRTPMAQDMDFTVISLMPPFLEV